MKKLYYCINNQSLTVLSYGELPETWGNITGMADLTPQAARDLTWAGYPEISFVTAAEALEIGVTQANLDIGKAAGDEIQGNVVRKERDALLTATDWVVTKAVELGQPIPNNYIVYRKALRDMPLQTGWPWSIVPVVLLPE